MVGTPTDSVPDPLDVGVSVTLGRLNFRVGNVEVVPVDGIKVEESPTTKYLGTRSGYLECCQRVLISVEGHRHELTRDDLPEEG